MKILTLSICMGIASLSSVAIAQDEADHADTPGLTHLDKSVPINAMCPVMPDEPIDPMFTAEYKGQTIGLCCKKCLRKFEADPEAYVENLSAFTAVGLEVEPDAEPEHDEDHEHAGMDAQEDHDAQGAQDDHDAEGDHDDEGEHAGVENEEHDDAEQGGEDHDHSVDHDDSGSKLLAYLGKFHPPATHLPIGMLIGAALAEIGLILTKRDMFRYAGGFCLSLAALGVLTAAPLGWLNGGFVLIDDDWVQTTHRWLGTSTAALTVLALALLVYSSGKSAEPRSRKAYRVVLFLAAGAVGATGFFGGALIYGINHYAW